METPQLLTRLEQDDEREWFYLIDRFRKEAIASIFATPQTIEDLNKPQWMQSRGWIYVVEHNRRYQFEIRRFRDS